MAHRIEEFAGFSKRILAKAASTTGPHRALEAGIFPLYSLFMGLGATDAAELREFPPPTPAPRELIARATELVKKFPECFWFWHPEARVQHLEDVRLVIEHLRKYGDHRAWREAQDLHKCLSPLFKKKY